MALAVVLLSAIRSFPLDVGGGRIAGDSTSTLV